jgi:hypothetical protein
MKSVYLVGIGVFVGMLAMYGCQKAADSPPKAEPPKVAAVETPATPNAAPVGPTTELEKMGAVKVEAPKAVAGALSAHIAASKPAVKRHATGSTSSAAEKAAYAKAAASAYRAACLVQAVNYKADYDQTVGSISDWGNVITDPICINKE